MEAEPLALPKFKFAASTDDCYTPASVMIPARLVLGGIDLDPASCATAQTVVQAKRWYGLADDGLRQPWEGRVWLNPPYSDPLPWAERLIEALDERKVSAALVLTNLATSPTWARLLWRRRTAGCLIGYRIRFWNPERDWKNGYDRDNQLLYFGPKKDVFSAVFGIHGEIV